MKGSPYDGGAPWLTEAAVGLAARLLTSHRQAFGVPLLSAAAEAGSLAHRAQELFIAPAAVLAHDGAADPRLTYANRAALTLFGRPWPSLVGLPSRLTAEPEQRAERARALERALRDGAFEGYGGIRVNRRGRRFRIEGARLWTVRDGTGSPCGQAAAFSRWWWL